MKLLDPGFKYLPAVATLPRNARSAVILLCTSVLTACAGLPTPGPLPELRSIDQSPVSWPVFVHEPKAGGDSSVPIAQLAVSRDVDFAYRECLAMQVVGQRTAASFGSGLRGRSDACH
jgi:hypothetical protein